MRIGLIGYEANVKKRVGSNQYAYELLWGLSRQDEKNEYLIYLPEPPLEDLPPQRQGWQYRIGGPKKGWNWFGLPKMIWADRKKVDLVFSPGHYAPLTFGLPLAVSVMDLGYLRFPDQFKKKDHLQLKHWTRWSVKRAGLVLAISEFTRRDLLERYRLESNRVVATPLGFNKEFVEQKVTPTQIKKLRQKYSLGERYLLYLGTLKPSKNLANLVEAFAKLAKKDKEVKLVLAGKKGWLYEEIFARVKRLGLEKRVVFTGFVLNQEVPVLMKAADLFVLVSFWEGFGIPALEAMALGTPVVASRVASLPEVVGKAGVLVDPDSPEEIAAGLTKALENRSELAKKGLVQAQKFSWERCAGLTLEAIETRFGAKN